MEKTRPKIVPLADSCCGTCHFYGVLRGSVHVCRRNPPAVHLAMKPVPGGVSYETITLWPGVEPDQWCGEFIHKQDA